jgi:hypothetical protein
MRRSAAVSLLVLLALTLAAPARGDGLPILGVDAGPEGVAGGAVRYVTLDGARGTVVAAVERRGGKIQRSRSLPGRFTVPAVAYDGSPSGLSADGRTLVLIRPRLSFPQPRTTLTVLDARTLRVRRTLRLRGDFSFDAVAPDGRAIFLVHYVSRTDPTRYDVRAYDLTAGRLRAQPIVDPRERGEKMRGFPVTRATSPDGRWAYTLYDGGGHEPFVHALDTASGRARCIDLPALEGRQDLFALRLRAGAARVDVLARRRPLLAVDARTFAVGRPAAPRPPHVADGHGHAWWPWAAGGVFVLGLLGLFAGRRYGSMRPAQITASQASSSSIEAARRAT